jgi:hypothetical protein
MERGEKAAGRRFWKDLPNSHAVKSISEVIQGQKMEFKKKDRTAYAQR